VRDPNGIWKIFPNSAKIVCDDGVMIIKGDQFEELAEIIRSIG
jgi:hypothetical protein